MTSALAGRLNNMIMYLNEDAAHYPLRLFPFKDMKWGMTDEGGKTVQTDILCVKSVPVRLWIVGELVAQKWMETGYNARKPGVMIRPLLEDDSRTARTILDNMSTPKVGMWLVKPKLDLLTAYDLFGSSI